MIINLKSKRVKRFQSVYIPSYLNTSWTEGFFFFEINLLKNHPKEIPADAQNKKISNLNEILEKRKGLSSKIKSSTLISFFKQFESIQEGNEKYFSQI